MHRLPIVSVLVLVWMSSSQVTGQVAYKPEDYSAEQLRTFFEKAVTQYKFESQQPVNLELQPKPILNLTNAARKNLQGSVFVWTQDGRPAILVTFITFTVRDGFMYRHQTNSMLEQPLRALLNGREVWTPKAASLVWHEFGSPMAGDSGARRLVQMRGLAKEFAGEKFELEGTRIELRVLPQPIYRYSSAKHDVVDGAMFILSESTEPTIYVIIEAFKNAESQTEFRWAAFPSHFITLNLYLGKEKVWSVPESEIIAYTREGQKPYSDEPYFAFFSRDPIPLPAELNVLADKAKEEKK